jgi:general secretion pathway protein D
MNRVKKIICFALLSLTIISHLMHAKKDLIEEDASFIVEEAIRANLEPRSEQLINEAIAAVESKEIMQEKLTKKCEHVVPEKKEVADIYLNFEDVSLASLVSYITDRKNLNIIPEKNLEQIKVSVKTEQPYTLSQALALVHTLLEKNGYSMVEVAGVHRIIPRQTVKQHPIPYYSSSQGIEPEDLPDTDAIIRYTYYLKNIKAAMANEILVNILGDNTVEVQHDLDVIIMTQKANSIKFAMKIINELDRGGLRQSIKMIKLQHTDPEIIAQLFNNEIIGNGQKQESIRFVSAAGKKESTYFSSSTKVIADSERFYLILMGQEEDIDRIIEFVYVFDRPDDAEDSRLMIINLRYIEADRAKAIIEKAIRPPAGSTDKQSLTSFKFFQDVVIAAETPKNGEDANYGCGNRLIIACNKEARPALQKLIDVIDKSYPQVALEILIVDVTQQLSRELSSQLRNPTTNFLGDSIQFQAAHASGRSAELGLVNGLDTNLINQVGSATEDARSAVFTLGDPGDSAENGNIWLYIRSLLIEEQSNILSQPFLIANNRQACSIESNEVRRVKGDFVGGTGVRSNIAQTDLPANTVLKITPRINADGIIDLSISINLEEFVDQAGADQPGRQLRTLDTRASMGEGQVLVLGGLGSSRQDQSFWHTPFLEKIPLLGNLFKGRQRKHNKQNLFVFIRPSIIKPRNEGNPDDYTQMKLDYAKYQVLNVDAYSGSKDPVQRWFFKPRNQDVKQRLKDVKAGIFRPIDDFKEGKYQPTEVDIKKDPYFQPNLKLEAYKKRQKIKQNKKEELVRPEPIIFRKKNTKDAVDKEMQATRVLQASTKNKSIFFKKPSSRRSL